MMLVAYTDGASRGNPGESGVGVIVKDERGTVVLSLNGYIGTATNNIAEYTALITLLERMRLFSCSKLIVHSDSELMVRQVNGKYKVKDRKLKVFHARVRELRSTLPFEMEIRYVPRTENRDADRLANLGLESRKPLPRVGERRATSVD